MLDVKQIFFLLLRFVFVPFPVSLERTNEIIVQTISSVSHFTSERHLKLSHHMASLPSFAFLQSWLTYLHQAASPVASSILFREILENSSRMKVQLPYSLSQNYISIHAHILGMNYMHRHADKQSRPYCAPSPVWFCTSFGLEALLYYCTSRSAKAQPIILEWN